MIYYIYLGFWSWFSGIKPGITSRLLGHRKNEHQHPIPGFAYHSAFKMNCTKDDIIRIERKVLDRTSEYKLPGYLEHEFRKGNINEIKIIEKTMEYVLLEEGYDPEKCRCSSDEYELTNDNSPHDEFPINWNPYSEDSLEDFSGQKGSFSYILKGYQTEAYEFIQNYEEKRLHMEVFCGGGKTIIYQKIFEDLTDEWDCFILIVPGITLMSDMKKRWEKQVKRKKWNTLYVSSEESYATTDQNVIKIIVEESAKLFVCITLHSFKKIEDVLRKFKVVYLIGDEAHHLCELNKKKVFSPLQYLKENPELSKPIKKMLFGTATPKTGNYESIRQDRMLMNNSKYFGEKVKLSGGPANLRRLRREGFLCPYQVIMGEVDPKDLKKVKSSLTKDQGNQHLNYQASAKLLKSLILKRDIKSKNYRKILMYTTGIGTLGETEKMTSKNLGVRDLVGIVEKEFKSLEKHLKIGIFYADSKRTNAENVEAVKDFEDSKGKYDVTILVNCRMYSEGINIPSLDTVVFCDPKQSLSEIIQIFGRPLRNDPENLLKIASIVVPYLSNLKYSNADIYKKILDIVQTISTQDEFLRDELCGVSFLESEESKKKESKEKIMKTAKLVVSKKRGVFPLVEFNANIKLFDFLKSKIFQEKCSSLEEAILVVLDDYIPKTPNLICEKILTGNLWYFVGGELVSNKCEDMWDRGILNHFVLGNQYFIEKPNIKMSQSEFVQSLTERNIFTEAQYRRVFVPLGYPDNYPPNPAYIYPGIWEQLITSSSLHYTFKECRELFSSKSYDILELFGKGYKSESDKNELLCKWDPKIPMDLKRTYKLKHLSELSKGIFDDGLDEFD